MLNSVIENETPVNGDDSLNCKTCEQCGNEFSPRNGNGGSPQRFCSQECRGSFHKAQRSQRAPACSALPAVIDPPVPEPSTEAPAANSDFDWNDTENVILQAQPETACYFNPYGSLVIRQHAE